MVPAHSCVSIAWKHMISPPTLGAKPAASLSVWVHVCVRVVNRCSRVHAEAGCTAARPRTLIVTPPLEWSERSSRPGPIVSRGADEAVRYVSTHTTMMRMHYFRVLHWRPKDGGGLCQFATRRNYHKMFFCSQFINAASAIPEGRITKRKKIIQIINSRRQKWTIIIH